MQKLSFFKGVFYGLLLSSFMWAGIFYTAKKIYHRYQQPKMSKVEPAVIAFQLYAFYAR